MNEKAAIELTTREIIILILLVIIMAIIVIVSMGYSDKIAENFGKVLDLSNIF